MAVGEGGCLPPGFTLFPCKRPGGSPKALTGLASGGKRSRSQGETPAQRGRCEWHRQNLASPQPRRTSLRQRRGEQAGRAGPTNALTPSPRPDSQNRLQHTVASNVPADSSLSGHCFPTVHGGHGKRTLLCRDTQGFCSYPRGWRCWAGSTEEGRAAMGVGSHGEREYDRLSECEKEGWSPAPSHVPGSLFVTN